ncbi:helix-turn-helix domain-containing protein [Chitinophaga alhagiae]|uniref:helix-turn-helix domain-containing protein n=1 Tax=Chitinophaga alhagiae TaxID=2203219 RepID=UPI000E5BEF1A|nr:helix-turn-helix transcriptional regulator [Chitinophaga alhagiae]
MLLFQLSCGSIFLLAFLLLSHVKSVHTGANRWLGVFYLFAGFAMLGAIMEQAGNRYAWLLPAMETTRFAMAPALYFSIRYYTGNPYRFRHTDLLHFLPALLFIPILLGVSRYLPPGTGFVVGLGIKVQLVVYWILGYRLLRQHRARLESVAPDTSGAALAWLKNLVILTGIMIVNFLLSPFIRPHAWEGTSYIIYLGAIYLSCYYAWRQGPVYPPREKETLPVPPPAGPPRLHEDEAAALKERLATLMREEKLYTEPELSLSELADRLEVSLHEVSWLLNKEIGKNFYQYVNHFRIEEAKELLHSPGHQHLSILAIGFTAGFNSKTAFNSAFRQIVGMTPAAFRNIVVRLDAGGQ